MMKTTNRLRPLPIRVPPVHHEPAKNYIRRAFNEHGLTDRSKLLILRHQKEHGVDRDTAAKAIAAAFAGETAYGNQAANNTHKDGSCCYRCVHGPERFACLRCTGGVIIRQLAHNDGQVCLRHRVWVGGAFTEQRPVSKATVLADRSYRRLRSRIDNGRLREVQRLLADHARLLGQEVHDSDLYPAAIKLYKLLLNQRFLGNLLDRNLTYQESYNLLDAAVSPLLDEQSSVTDGLWLILRPAALSVYELLQYGEDRADEDPHDIQLPEALAGVIPRTARPLEPFIRYLLPLRTNTADQVRHEIRVRVHRPPQMTERIDLRPGKGAPIAMVCPNGHRIESTPTRVATAVAKGTPCCGYCTIRRYRGESGLAQTDPLLFAELDKDANPGVDPDHLPLDARVHWRCVRAGHPAFSRVDNRRAIGCVACRRLTVVQVDRPEYAGNPSSTFLIKFPEKASSYYSALNEGQTLDGVSHTSKDVRLWKCDNGHVWPATVESIAHDHGCGYCANRFVWPGSNDLATCEPSVAAEWDYVRNGSVLPTDVYHLSTKEFAWKCSRGHEWSISPRDRIRRNLGCPYCCGAKKIPGETCLAATDPEAAALLHPFLNSFTAGQIGAGSQRLAFFTCPCGDIYLDTIRLVARREHKVCKSCRNRRARSGA